MTTGETADTLLATVRPQVVPPLDPAFQPMLLGMRRYRAALAQVKNPARLFLALEREGGLVSRFDVDVLPADSPYAADTMRYAERIIKFLLWARGGWRLTLAGDATLVARLRGLFKPGAVRAFDADLMARAYGRPFEVVVVSPAEMPPERAAAAAIGGHWSGCRIGFDLGASDYKLAAVKDGEPVYTEEVPWAPSVEKDPQYHVQHIVSGLKKAAAHLPRVDGIGGSSAGIYVDNQPRVASLFRAVPADAFDRVIRPMFLNLAREWGVPVVVANDGDVTALAGALSLSRNAMLGVAMGSSEAAGFLDGAGRITGWLNELAFAPVDLNPAAAADEWSGDCGVGALYFSQQAVNKLAPAAGIIFPAEMKLPERLKEVQARAERGDPAAGRIFESIGVYLGYTIPLYAEFYDLQNLLILGRVTSGTGGEILFAKAKAVLAAEFPEHAARIGLFVPDEKTRRLGQAVAAASLPEVGACREPSNEHRQRLSPTIS